MTITLSPDRLAWIEVRVAKGDFPDVDGAVHDLLAAGMADYAEVEDDDMAWAKPLVDEALAAIDRGDTIPWRSSRLVSVRSSGHSAADGRCRRHVARERRYR